MAREKKQFLYGRSYSIGISGDYKTHQSKITIEGLTKTGKPFKSIINIDDWKLPSLVKDIVDIGKQRAREGQVLMTDIKKSYLNEPS